MKKSTLSVVKLCLLVVCLTFCLNYLTRNVADDCNSHIEQFQPKLIRPSQSFHVDLNNAINKTVNNLNNPLIVANESLSNNLIQNESTTCNESMHRGFHQKVIGISLYGPFDDPHHYTRYGETFKAAVEQINIKYPDWVIRVYHNYKSIKEPDYVKLQNLVEGYTNVDFCNATKALEENNLNVQTFEMNWRFLPLLDPAVDFFMSRDADCHIFQREVDAVNHWLQQPKNSTFHIMRDHPLHETEMLGGLWGAKVHQRREDIKTAMTKMLKRKPKNGKGMDQLLLGMYIWPLALHDMVAHDSYLCYRYPNTQPFPTQRQGDQFIGMIVEGNSPVGRAEICPEKCRPLRHKDWIFC